MPSPQREEIDHTHFLRDWNKLPVAFVRRGEFPRLSFEAQGVFVQLLAFSEDQSQIPGGFQDKATGVALREDELVYQVAGSVERLDAVKAALGALKRAKLVAYIPGDGYSIPNFDEMFSTEKERKKIRDANKIRQRRKRQRDAQSSTVVPLRQEASR